MIAVEFPQGVAVIDGYKWASKNKQLEEGLNLMLDPDGPSGATPYPDLEATNEAMEQFGGKIIKQELREYPPKDAIL